MAPSAATEKSPSMKQLTAKLKEAQSSLQDISTFIKCFKKDTTVFQIEVRLEKLDELWEKFGETLVEIKSHDDFDDEDEVYDKERREFSNRYYEAKSFLMDQVKERKEPPSVLNSTRFNDSSTQGAVDNVRLPQIKLQSFNGDIDEWLSFLDLFTSLIHWKTDLPEVEKFHYLKGCLQGEPRILIDPLKLTKANYQVAWDLLLKRYNNSKQLKKKQVQTLLSLPTLSKESVSELYTLLDGFERVVQTLDQVVQPAEYKDLLLVNILSSHLDPVTRRGWEEFSSAKENDSLEDLTEFLKRRVRVLESLPSKSVDTRGVHQQQPQPKQRQSIMRTSFNTAQASGGRCAACSANHPLFHCNTFKRLSVSERDGLLKTHSLCRNCFRAGHLAKDCQSKYSCRICKARHHSLVCFKSERDGESKVAAVGNDKNTSSSKESEGDSNTTTSQVANVAASTISTSNSAQKHSSQILLATAVIMVEDKEGTQYLARALLDSGSESNFITERLCQRMRVTRDKVDVSVLGIGQTSSRVKHRIRAMVRSRITSFSREMDFLILPKVTVNLPTTSIKIDGWTIPSGIELADPAFFESNRVDIVLGIESFFDFFETGKRISLGEQLPILKDSVFGWVVSGEHYNSNQETLTSCNTSASENLESLIARFWESEEIGSAKALSPEEIQCEESFKNTVQRNPDGRYTVSLPKSADALSRLGESWDIVYRRLQGTERRLEKNVDLHKS